jgi:hypothetical protein
MLRSRVLEQNQWRRRLNKRDVHQPLDHFSRTADVDTEAAQQHDPECRLNEDDRGER